MTIEYTYIADDGTEFDNEEECQAYEDSIKHNLEGVVFFNDSKDILTELQDIDYYTQFMLIVDPKKAKDLFDWLYDYCGFAKPECDLRKGDVLFYEDEWVSCSAEIEKCQSLLWVLDKTAVEVKA